MRSSEILTRDNKTEAINKISDTSTYSSETQSARESNLEVDRISANSKQKNMHMINKQMMASTAVKQTSGCADSSPKSSLESPGGTHLDTTSNVVTGETGDGVTTAPTDDAETFTLEAE